MNANPFASSGRLTISNSKAHFRIIPHDEFAPVPVRQARYCRNDVYLGNKAPNDATNQK
jgi:hypothetical protein